MHLYSVALYATISGNSTDCLSLELFHCNSEEQAEEEMKDFVIRSLLRQGIDEDRVHIRHIKTLIITAGDLVG